METCLNLLYRAKVVEGGGEFGEPYDASSLVAHVSAMLLV